MRVLLRKVLPRDGSSSSASPVADAGRLRACARVPRPSGLATGVGDGSATGSLVYAGGGDSSNDEGAELSRRAGLASSSDFEGSDSEVTEGVKGGTCKVPLLTNRSFSTVSSAEHSPMLAKCSAVTFRRCSRVAMTVGIGRCIVRILLTRSESATTA